MSNNNLKYNLLALSSVFVWGTSYVFAKKILTVFSPLEFLIARFLLAFIFLCLIYPKRLKLESKEEFFYCIAGLFGVPLFYIFESLALSYTQASNVGIIVSTSPIITSILSQIFFKVKLSKSFYLGLLVSIIGIIIITLNGKLSLELNPLGDILALFAAMFWAIYSIILNKIVGSQHNVIQVTRRIFLYGLLWLIPFTFIMDFNVNNMVLFLKPEHLTKILYLALIASGICFITWNYAVEKLGILRISLYLYLVPVFGIINAVIFLKEKFTFISFCGSLLIISGMLISRFLINKKIHN